MFYTTVNFCLQVLFKIFNCRMEQAKARFSKEYSNILQLIDLVLALPATSTACERGFSHMELIKTGIRKRLSEQVLLNSILIKLHSPPTGQFNPTPAVKYWLELKPRRPASSRSIENKQKGL